MIIKYDDIQIMEVYGRLKSDLLAELSSLADEDDNLIYPNEDSFEFIMNESQEIEDFIYSKYSHKKQSQDEKWLTSYTAKLKARLKGFKVIENLEEDIVARVVRFLSGEKLDVIVSDIKNERQKKYVLKLVKIGIRTQWAEDCIDIATEAILESKEAVFPPFPKDLTL